MRRFVLILLVCFCFPATTLAADPTDSTGMLAKRYLDPVAHDREADAAYVLKTARGTVALGSDQPDELVGQRVVVRDGSARPGVQGRARAESSTRLAGPTDLGPHRVAVVMVNFTDNRTRPVTADGLRSTVFSGANSVNRFYQEQSNGSVSIIGRDRPDGDVYGWYELPISSAGCDVDAIASAGRSAANAAGVSLAGYDHVVFYYPTVQSCAFGGLGDLPGSESWINGYNQANIIAHEIGHNMGAHHAASIACTTGGAPTPISGSCAFTEYGDAFDVMGNSPRLMSSWHRAQLGQLDMSAQATVRGSGTYSIGTPNDFASSATKLLMVPRKRAGVPTSEFYAIEIRSPYGTFDNWTSAPNATTGVTVRLVPLLTIHTQSRLIDANPQDGGVSNAPLQPGQTLTDTDYGITIQNVSSGGGSAQLAITVPAIADSTPPSIPTNVTGSFTGSSVHLSWGASSDDEAFDRYEIYRNGSLLGSTQSLGFDDTNLAGVDVASYRIDALDVAGNRSSSSTVTVIVPPSADQAPPSAVDGLVAKRSGSSVTLAWRAATDNRGVARYVVFRDGSKLSNASSLGLTDRKAGLGKHTYQVAAVDTSGLTGPRVSVTVAASPFALSSPKLRSGEARVPKSGRLVFTAKGAKKSTLKLGSKTVRRGKGKITYTLPSKYRRKSSAKLTLTATIKGKRQPVTFTIKRGIITV